MLILVILVATAVIAAGVVAWVAIFRLLCIHRSMSSQFTDMFPDLPGWPECPERTQLILEYADIMRSHVETIRSESRRVGDLEIPHAITDARRAYEDHMEKHGCDRLRTREEPAMPAMTADRHPAL
jgi:hypothetical protein